MLSVSNMVLSYHIVFSRMKHLNFRLVLLWLVFLCVMLRNLYLVILTFLKDIYFPGSYFTFWMVFVLCKVFVGIKTASFSE